MYEGAFPLKLTHNLKSSFQTGFGASALSLTSNMENEKTKIAPESFILLCSIAITFLHLLSQNGMTPLIPASHFGHTSVVRVLLQAGATINTTTQVKIVHARYYLMPAKGWASICSEAM